MDEFSNGFDINGDRPIVDAQGAQFYALAAVVAVLILLALVGLGAVVSYFRG